MSTKMLWLGAAVALGSLIEGTTATIPPIITSAYDEVRKNHASPSPRIRGAARRQAESPASEFTVTVAPDATCGFLSGSSGNAITCDNGNPCSWEPNNINAIFCGVATDAVRLQCLERDAATDTAFCNDVCQSNTFNLLCTETSAPYCRTYAFPDGVRDYRCAPTPVPTIQSVEYTYDGQIDRQFETETLSTEPTTTAETAEENRTASPVPTSLEPTSTPTSSPTPDSSPPPAPAKEDSTPVGAIVGGAMGGVAVIVFLILGVFFLRRRSSKTDVTPPADHGPTTPMHQQHQYQQGYPNPPPQGDASIAGAKSGMVSPVLSAGYAAPTSPTYEGHQQDVHRMSQPYAPAGPGGYQQPVVYEMGLEGGHHKGQLHELH